MSASAVSLVVGTMRLCGWFDGLMVHTESKPQALSLLTAAVKSGMTIVDTAPLYARGDAERVVGKLARDYPVRIWTKVGVDIQGILPRVDFSLEGMQRSVSGSLERLGVERVAAIFVHNPTATGIDPGVATDFAGWCRRSGVADSIGIAMLPFEAYSPELLDAFDAFSCEPVALVADPDLAPALRRRGSLVLRTLFGGGRLFDSAEAIRSPADFVVRRLRAFEQQYHPAALVVGPRTRAQLKEYLPFMEQIGQLCC